MDQQIVNIPDRNFKNYLVRHFDKNKDGEISLGEALSIEKIYCASMGIKTLNGIEFFHNLKDLDCKENDIKIIDLRQNKKIEYFKCEGNGLLEEINLIGCPSLVYFNCIGCFKIKKLDISNNLKLKSLFLGNSNLTWEDPDLSKHIELEKLSLAYNHITNIDLSKNRKLKELNVRSCNLKVLDLTNNTLLERIICINNDLEFIYLSLTPNLKFFSFTPNDTLKAIYTNILPSICNNRSKFEFEKSFDNITIQIH